MIAPRVCEKCCILYWAYVNGIGPNLQWLLAAHFRFMRLQRLTHFHWCDRSHVYVDVENSKGGIEGLKRDAVSFSSLLPLLSSCMFHATINGRVRDTRYGNSILPSLVKSLYSFYIYVPCTITFADNICTYFPFENSAKKIK